MVFIEASRDNRLKYLSPIDLIRSQDRCTRIESDISITDIIDEPDVAIDDRRVNELASSMMYLGCQLEPSMLAAIEENGQVKYIVINGFHRKKAAEKANIKNINAIILYGCSEEDIYDLRVIASTPKSVGFARGAEWIQKSFNKSVWAKRGLTLLQILNIAKSYDTGKRISTVHYRISQNDVLGITDWVADKSKKWKKPLTSLIIDFYCIEHSFPEIINQVRINYCGSHEGRGVLNLSKFKQMIEIFPKNLAMQIMMLDLIKIHNLDSSQVKSVGEMIKKLIEDNQLEDMKSQIYKNPKSLISTETLENDNSLAKHHKKSQTSQTSTEKPMGDTNHGEDNKQYKIEKMGKESQITNLTNQIFYKNLDLADKEKEIAGLFFENGLDINEIAARLKITTSQASYFFWNVLIKYRVYVQDNLLQHNLISQNQQQQ